VGEVVVVVVDEEVGVPGVVVVVDVDVVAAVVDVVVDDDVDVDVDVVLLVSAVTMQHGAAPSFVSGNVAVVEVPLLS
jgi:hypothetical protein